MIVGQAAFVSLEMLRWLSGPLWPSTSAFLNFVSDIGKVLEL